MHSANKTPVIDRKTGKKYPSISACARDLDVNVQALTVAVRASRPFGEYDVVRDYETECDEFFRQAIKDKFGPDRIMLALRNVVGSIPATTEGVV